MVATDAALAVFLLSPLALAAFAAALCAGIAVLVWLLMFRLVTPVAARTPQGAYHVSLTALFALILSFTANDAWRRSDSAYAALLREVNEASGLMQLTAAVSDGPALQAGLRDYLAATLRGEWARSNAIMDSRTEEALQRLRGLTLAGLTGPNALAARLALDRVEGIAQARTTRLVAGGLYGDAMRWSVLVALFTFGLTGIALVHWDRPHSAPYAMALYAAAAAVALAMVAAGEHPYAGYDPTTPERLVELLAKLG